VKIATYNMQHHKRGKTNWDRVFDGIRPDILLAQESLNPSEYQKPLLGRDWSEDVAWELVIDGWGSAVYAKSGKPRSLSLPAYQGWVVGVELDSPWNPGENSGLRVFSLHAPSGKDSYQKAVNGILDMIREYRDHCDILIGGDFNLTVGERQETEDRKTSTADRKIQSRLRDEFGLINCWQTANPNLPLPQTLRWDRERTAPYHCDGIFVSQSWASRLKSCEVLSGDGWDSISDHNPVVAEFE